MFVTGLLRLNKFNSIKQDSVSVMVSANLSQISARQKEIFYSFCSVNYVGFTFNIGKYRK